ncbi:LacI family DNA-binding transcriptional regulator [Halovulum dunhuangense]|uniref:LacI family DNA-binding transcriptional regulator n=1 Tax=Halovulum dunhuangense TaxID=1505036 RepID=A0A849L837_9RHOB|nr:LacI family DNA-binding transcriptional regulator [Halovulum dunhuangense]
MHASTVSRVMDPLKRKMISPQVVEKVLKVARELDYTPNEAAAGLRRRTSRTLGFIVPDISDPIYPRVLRGVEDATKERGYMVLLGNAGNSYADASRILRRMSARVVEGLLIGTTRLEDPLIQDCLDNELPTVSVMRRSNSNSISSVTVDNREGMRMMVDLCLARGHREFCVVAGPQNISTGHDRHEGCLDALEARGISLEKSHIYIAKKFTVEEGALAVKQLLGAQGLRPTVIICANDLLAIGAMNACRSFGLDCPRDISITGFNDIEFAKYLSPPLTTVTTDAYAIGFKSATLLLDLLESGGRQVTNIRITPQLRERASLRAIDHPA